MLCPLSQVHAQRDSDGRLRVPAPLQRRRRFGSLPRRDAKGRVHREASTLLAQALGRGPPVDGHVESAARMLVRGRRLTADRASNKKEFVNLKQDCQSGTKEPASSKS